jgi:hypothetical protein
LSHQTPVFMTLISSSSSSSSFHHDSLACFLYLAPCFLVRQHAAFTWGQRTSVMFTGGFMDEFKKWLQFFLSWPATALCISGMPFSLYSNHVSFREN